MIAVMLFLVIFFSPVSLAHAGPLPETQSHMSLRIVPHAAGAEAKTLKLVLLCDTPESRSRGLQGFRPLKKNEAALFLFEEPQRVSFWMGSVSYPIDIIFVAADGTVSKVFKNRQPGSLDIYSSDGPVLWAIETAAGSGIKRGDKVEIK